MNKQTYPHINMNTHISASVCTTCSHIKLQCKKQGKNIQYRGKCEIVKTEIWNKSLSCYIKI